MFVAAFTADVLVPTSRSRKDKRSVVKPLVAELSRLGVSAAETGHLDLLRRAEVAVAVVSSTARHAGEVLDSCERVVRARPEIEVVTIERRLWKGSDDDPDGIAVAENPDHADMSDQDDEWEHGDG